MLSPTLFPHISFSNEEDKLYQQARKYEVHFKSLDTNNMLMLVDMILSNNTMQLGDRIFYALIKSKDIVSNDYLMKYGLNNQMKSEYIYNTLNKTIPFNEKRIFINTFLINSQTNYNKIHTLPREVKIPFLNFLSTYFSNFLMLTPEPKITFTPIPPLFPSIYTFLSNDDIKNYQNASRYESRFKLLSQNDVSKLADLIINDREMQLGDRVFFANIKINRIPDNYLLKYGLQNNISVVQIYRSLINKITNEDKKFFILTFINDAQRNYNFVHMLPYDVKIPFLKFIDKVFTTIFMFTPQPRLTPTTINKPLYNSLSSLLSNQEIVKYQNSKPYESKFKSLTLLNLSRLTDSILNESSMQLSNRILYEIIKTRLILSDEYLLKYGLNNTMNPVIIYDKLITTMSNTDKKKYTIQYLTEAQGNYKYIEMMSKETKPVFLKFIDNYFRLTPIP